MSSFVILSYGRSGSVLLAHNVGRIFGSLPTYAKLESQLVSPVVHTHLQLPADKFSGYQRIFNLRADPVETVLSFVIADHYNKYHKFINQEQSTLTPFDGSPDQVNLHCRQLITWHKYYSTQLNSTDVVIVYEHMIDLLTTSVYDRIYLDKGNILLNYSEIRSACEQHRDQMLDSIEPFLLHKNTQDIKTYINYDV
jgi:hypothetical protein